MRSERVSSDRSMRISPLSARSSFICELIEDTGHVHLTEAEAKAEYKNVWMPFDEALKMFEGYEKYHSWNLPDYGLYRREYHALTEYAERY